MTLDPEAQRPTPRPRFRPALLDALRDTPRAQWGKDIVAGLVVGVVALPLAIAFAIASGADPRAGLVTVVIAGGLAALFGGSRLSVSGPTGAFVVVLYAIVAEHGFANLLVATFIAGVLLLLAGIFRLGQVIKFIPYPVTTGFTAGIAVVIFVGQLPDLFGLRLVEAPAEPLLKLWAVAQALADLSPWALGVALATIGIIQLLKRLVPRVPGPVVALVILSAIVQVAALPVTTVGDKFGALPAGLPTPELPDLSWDNVREMFPSAVTIALLGAIESLLACVVADGMTGQRHDSNQELIGQGVANMASPLFGGLAATGAIARTATNVQNGGRTPLSAIVHAVVVLAVLYIAAPLASLVPMAVLAGILVVVAWNMSERYRFLHLLRMPRADAGVMVAVFLLTVAIDLTVAVTVGLLLATGIFLHRMSEMTRVSKVDPLRDEARTGHTFKAEDVPAGVVVYSIDGPFFFGAADRFQETMARVAEAPKVVVLRLREVPYLDATGLNALQSAIEGLQKRGSRVMLSGIQAQPLDMLQRSGAVHLVGDGNVHRTTADALRHAQQAIGQQ